MENLDFIAVGDVVTDAFIKLKDAEVTCDEAGRKCLLNLRFGDKVAYESVTVIKAVGNSPNAAVAAARLGLKAGLVSNLGDDQNGSEIIGQLRQEKINLDQLTVHPKKNSNYHYVLWFGDDRTILVKHEEYAYVWPEVTPPQWLYLSSLGENSLSYHQEIERYLMSHPEVKLAFQPGTFQMKLGKDKLAGIYKLTEAFFCNVAEAKRILQTAETEIKKLLAMIYDLGPKIVVITDGPAGAYMLTNGEYWHMPIYPDPKPPVERTGAGDAFAATFVAMLALGKEPLEALKLAPINSMNVVQYIGAQEGLLSKGEIGKYLADSLSDYKPKKI